MHQVILVFASLLIIMSSSVFATSSRPYLLRISVSNRPAEVSFSSRIMAEFSAEFAKQHPDVEIRDSFITPREIPHLDFVTQEAGRVEPAKQTEEERSRFQLASDLTDELLGATHVVIATPMHNWGPPSGLKAWIDRIVNSRTFKTPPANLLAGIPFTIIVASGGPYSVDAPGSRPQMDFLRPYLKHVFTMLGAAADDVLFVNCDPTGPVDRGLLAMDDPTSGVSRARALLPAAAARRKPMTGSTASEL